MNKRKTQRNKHEEYVHDKRDGIPGSHQTKDAGTELHMKKNIRWSIPELFIATRILFLLVTYIGIILLTQKQYADSPITLSTFLQSWQQWDATIYVRIAQSGYKPPYDMAFSPFYPLLIRLLARLSGGSSYLLWGMIISNLALLGALYVIYQLAVEAGGAQVARRTLLYLCIFPTTFFFFAAYNEALFLLLTSASFLAMRKQRWWIAGISGFLAALTRSTGVLLVIPYLCELWLIRDDFKISKIKTMLARIPPIILIPSGLLIYCWYCWRRTGNPIEFASVQTHWSRVSTLPWVGIIQALGELFWNQPFGSFNEVHIFLDLSATVGFIALAIYGLKRLRPGYSLWICLLMLATLCSSSIRQHDSLISNQRFVIEMFPGFISLAMLGIQHPRVHQLILWIFPLLLATLSLLFILGKWMV